MNNAGIFKFKEEIDWSIPVLFQYESIWLAIYNSFKKYNINLPKINVYGSPNVVWTGGRHPAVVQELSASDLYKIFNCMLETNAIPTIVFANSKITENILKDRYANYILDVSLDINARYIVTSDILKDYIKNLNEIEKMIINLFL